MRSEGYKNYEFFSQADAAQTASQAVLLNAQVHPIIRVRREIEGQESFEFKAIFKR